MFKFCDEKTKSKGVWLSDRWLKILFAVQFFVILQRYGHCVKGKMYFYFPNDLNILLMQRFFCSILGWT